MARVSHFVCVLALALAGTGGGCNSLFGNERVGVHDAQYFDVPVDGPFACPALGAPPPEFGVALHGVFVQGCTDYSFQGDRASATCADATGAPHVHEGPLEGPLAQVPALDDPPTLGQYDQARLSPDGQVLYARHSDFVNTLEVRYAERQGDGTWKLAGVAPVLATLSDGTSTVAHGPDGDHLLVIEAGTGTLHEWVGARADWKEIRSQTKEDLGVRFSQVKMSVNGLHVVGNAPDGMFYTDRPSLDVAFRTPEKFPTAPLDPTGALMTDDCARLYVAGLGEVFYAQQR